ncbi:hypothetical protein NKR23_g3091 [Pleurostoma richardsiae]|uniref:Aminoglycoside phosphotransferase domain-containing protein n=1 Tax=Pleurostoma richardsiae TaxID=41990 RepID=A0AA38VTW0_9PEZI|nr:hypothetical protein NKR23_g3091 [Pleurostoma richardsiae]
MLFPLVNKSFLERCCTPLQPQSPTPPSVFIYREKYLVKFGPHVHPGEIEVMDLLNTQCLPVPKVLHHGNDPGTGWYYFYMRRVEGRILSDVWDHLSHSQQHEIVIQLQRIIGTMRLNKNNHIGSLGGLPCNDNFFVAPLLRERAKCRQRYYGPFSDGKAFTEGIAQYLTTAGVCDEEDRHMQCTLRDMLQMGSKSEDEFVLTHGEIAAENILVEDGNVVAILDWNQAGFYPVYWEYVKAWLFEPWSYFQRDNVIPSIMNQYDNELSIMKHAYDLVWR